MRAKKIIAELRKKYPGKRIFKNDEDNPTEILCEVDPSAEHPEYSLAVGVIDRSLPHFHQKTTEKYRVIKGRLYLYKNDQKFVLREGAEMIVNPGEIHWAKGDEAWIECYSKPGWVQSDYNLGGG